MSPADPTRALRCLIALVAVLGVCAPGAAASAPAGSTTALGSAATRGWSASTLAPGASATTGLRSAATGSISRELTAVTRRFAVAGTPTDDGADAADAAASPSSTALAQDPTPPAIAGAWLARIVYRTGVHAGPSSSSRRLGRVAARSPWGGQNQLLVLRSARTGGVLWLDVRLPGRPNASHGWIAADYAALSRSPWRVEVNRKSRRLSVWRGAKIVRRGRVVVGASATPTPAGLFAIADAVRQPDPVGFVGRWVLPLTAYSDVLKTFDGGDGQAAFHGRSGASLNDPLGSARSHGCIRLDNAMIAWLARKVPVGTPVTIT